MLCCRCRREIPDGSMFCNFCGKRQTGAPPPQRKAHRRSRGAGTVYKRKDEKLACPWVARFCNKHIGYYATSGEAILALDAFVASQKPIDFSTITFAQVFEKWKPRHYETVSDKAQAAYSGAFARAEPLHKRKMRDLKTADYQSVIDAMRNMSRSSCEKQRQLFSQLCKYAMQQDIIDKNYAQFLVLPKAPPPKDRVLSIEEIQSIWTMQEDTRLGDTANITLALIYTGMRINELLHLRREDVHLQEGYVVGGEKTEAGRDRVIPLHPDVMPIFQSWWDHSAGCVWLIPSANGNARDADGVRKSFNSLMRKLNIAGVTPHTCRHTAATLMATAQVPTDVIKRILGHTDYAFTSNRYTSTNVSSLIAGIQKVHSIK